ncbi:MAG: Nif3-like dinuclear metal center hexameric protein [Patescibacteria group bacterium]
MEAQKLYEQLEKDFITSAVSDDWFDSTHMQSVAEFLCDNFKQRSMGLVCGNSEEIEKVYTAVFPSDAIMRFIIDKKEEDIMLFVHHPQIWDIRNSPDVFQDMNRNLLQRFKEKRISIYNLHSPLDNFGEFSTSNNLAKVLGVEVEKSFAPYHGGLCGVFGKTELMTVLELKNRFELILGHRASLYDYGLESIANQNVAIVAGGGNDVGVLEEAVKKGINVFITGIAAKNDHSKKAHDFAKENKINILGGTHYSTEKFACMAICEYFKKLGLLSEFIVGESVMEDI